MQVELITFIHIIFLIGHFGVEESFPTNSDGKLNVPSTSSSVQGTGPWWSERKHFSLDLSSWPFPSRSRPKTEGDSRCSQFSRPELARLLNVRSHACLEIKIVCVCVCVGGQWHEDAAAKPLRTIFCGWISLLSTTLHPHSTLPSTTFFVPC